ncbi:hypothetical protein ILUMI_10660 [Ignelater luminosus]|uniref:protein-tyrosine-phosphatase n=1 Tax=Ignelater luminosus TaxID=2038154 RepID=A0A8K0GB95_IGNLU|nr:hypothetical protein ILUMI_10660 [Ignelater luminosus]
MENLSFNITLLLNKVYQIHQKNAKNMWDKDTPVLQWDHPFITNGPLVNFTIEITVLQSEYSNHINSYDVLIDTYHQTYYHKMPYLKFSTLYNISVFPVNKFKGKPSRNVTIKMPPPEPKLSDNINISCIEFMCQMNISKLENISHSSYLYVVVNNNISTDETLDGKQILLNSAQSDDKQSNVWLAVAKSVGNYTAKFISIKLGDGTISNSEYGDVTNKPLQNDTNYVITIILANRYLNKTRYSQPCNIFRTSKERNVKLYEGDAAISPLFLLLLFLFIPIVIGGLLFYKKKRKSNEESNHFFNKTKLSSCFKGNTDENEHLPLHTFKAKSALAPKSKSNNLSLEDADENNPLLSQNNSKQYQFTCRIELEDFEEYVKQSIGTSEEGELMRQHNLFVRDQAKPWEYGLQKPNKFKNRYNNLIAYDHSRVILDKVNNDEFSDYINANYVDGYKKPKAYIATQGPKPTTVGDFWRMIWQENISTIVTVANVEEDGKRKMEEYWPKLDNTIEYSSMEIYHKKSEIFTNYVYRTLIVTKDNEQHTIQQLHFTSWPDHGVPLYSQSLVPFVKRILTVPQDSAPIVVHCSAGVGRTGTIILCDYMLRMAANEKAVDFLAALRQMREQRANLVDNANQYKLAHLVVLEALFGVDTTIACDHELEQKIETLINNNGLHEQLEYLEKISWQDQVMFSSYKVNIDPANYNKNRFSNIVPDNYGRVYLSRYPTSDEHSDYINAIEVDDYHLTSRFIVTQQPLPNTIRDFWRMVSAKNVTTIVSLNEINLQNKTSCIFWPEVEEVFDLEFATIKCTEKEEYPSHDFLKILLISGDNDHEYSLTISILSMKNWHPLQLVPTRLDSLISFWEETSRTSRGHYPIIVTCYDGATACGVFAALSFLIEKIKLEQICDVCLAVRTVRHNRKQFVRNVEQLELLYKAAIQYLKSFETYSNFQIINK